MKRSLLFSILTTSFVAALAIAAPVSAHAEETKDTSDRNADSKNIMIGDETRPRWPGPTKTETREKMEDRRVEVKENMEARREAVQIRFDDFRKDKINRLIEMMKQRFLAAIERLQSIALRIEARIEKIEDETGSELTEARDHLKEARERLANAESAINAIDASGTDLFADQEKSGERFGSLRKLFGTAKEEIKAARESLRRALQAIGERFSKGPNSRPEIPVNN